MKKILLALLTAATLWGCNKNGGDDPPAIKIDNPQSLTQTVYADQGEGSASVNFTTTGAWTSAITETTPVPNVAGASVSRTGANPLWIKISPESGDKAGAQSFTIYLDHNYTGDDRSAKITISSGGKSQDVTVTQKAVKEDGTVPEDPDGVLINGILWAKRNVGSAGTFDSYEESLGKFYQWNRIRSWSATDPDYGVAIPHWDETVSWDSKIWEKANDPCPAGWRVPTLAEFKSLLDTEKVSSEWVGSPSGLDTRYGYKFTDKRTGNSIFFRAAGERLGDDGMLFPDSRDRSGAYWGHDPDSEGIHATSIILMFSISDSPQWYTATGNRGLPIRCVKE